MKGLCVPVKRFLCGVLVALSLSCASMGEQMLKAGYDPSYAAGFSDGEGSGSRAGGNPYAGFAKDTRRFSSDEQYAQGWRDGYDQAKGRYEATSRNVNGR